MSKDRPAGMDDTKFTQPLPNQKSKPMGNSEIAGAAKVASGPVDTGGGRTVKLPTSVNNR